MKLAEKHALYSTGHPHRIPICPVVPEVRVFAGIVAGIVAGFPVFPRVCEWP